MVEGRQRNQWRLTSELIATIAEVNRNRKKRHRPYKWRDFYPFDLGHIPQSNGSTKGVHVWEIADRLGLK